jgi:hypothetical protein
MLAKRLFVEMLRLKKLEILPRFSAQIWRLESVVKFYMLMEDLTQRLWGHLTT